MTCQAYKSLKYVRNKEIKLAAGCSNCPGGNALYTWSIQGMNDGREVLLNSGTVKSPLSSSVLILSENILDGKQSYEVEVKAVIQGICVVYELLLFNLRYIWGKRFFCLRFLLVTLDFFRPLCIHVFR